ncbi:MAG: quinol monooxygenase YgiN [Cellvibrionaceae bacterium]|jgi:quinol monooxygenase YgiN
MSIVLRLTNGSKLSNEALITCIIKMRARMYAVIVKFEVKPDAVETFKPLMLKQAENSLLLEPDCQFFDVSQDDKTPQLFYLYELYTHQDAFDEHLKSKHFLSFLNAVSRILVNKEILTANRLC